MSFAMASVASFHAEQPQLFTTHRLRQLRLVIIRLPITFLIRLVIFTIRSQTLVVIDLLSIIGLRLANRDVM